MITNNTESKDNHVVTYTLCTKFTNGTKIWDLYGKSTNFFNKM